MAAITSAGNAVARGQAEGVDLVTDDHVRDLQQRFQLQFWHQIMTFIGIPLLGFLIGLIGWFTNDTLSGIRTDIASLRTDSRQVVADIAMVKQDNAVHTAEIGSLDRRTASLEDWRAGFQSFTPRKN